MWSDQSAREYGTTPAQPDAGQGLGISRMKTNLDFKMNDVVVVLMGVKRRTGGKGKIHMLVLRQRMVLSLDLLQEVPRAVVLRLWCDKNHSECLLEPIPRVSDSTGQGWGPNVHFSQVPRRWCCVSWPMF